MAALRGSEWQVQFVGKRATTAMRATLARGGSLKIQPLRPLRFVG